MNKPDERIVALLVDSDLQGRSKLKEAAMADYHFKKVTPLNTLDDALNFINDGQVCDVCFIKSVYEQDEIDAFMEDAKKTTIGQECAYIMVLNAQGQTEGNASQNLMGGMHGFLMEPFSVDSMTEISRIAARVKKEAQEARVMAAVKITLSGVAEQIDKAYVAKKLDVPRKPGASILKQSTMDELRRAQNLPNRDIYVNSLIEVFENAKVPKGMNYTGPSERVKERMRKKLMAEAAGG